MVPVFLLTPYRVSVSWFAWEKTMNFTLFELAQKMLAALHEADQYMTEYDAAPLDRIRAAIAKAESAGIVARPVEQA